SYGISGAGCAGGSRRRSVYLLDRASWTCVASRLGKTVRIREMWAHFAAWFQLGEPPKAAKMRHSFLPASRCGTLCSSMPKPKTERRLRSRIAARLPVSVRSGNENLESAGYTRDLSMSGVFLYTDSQIREGSELEMVLMLPPELTEGERRWVCCQG